MLLLASSVCGLFKLPPRNSAPIATATQPLCGLISPKAQVPSAALLVFKRFGDDFVDRPETHPATFPEDVVQASIAIITSEIVLDWRQSHLAVLFYFVWELMVLSVANGHR